MLQLNPTSLFSSLNLGLIKDDATRDTFIALAKLLTNSQQISAKVVNNISTSAAPLSDFVNSFATDGYSILPGGLILQWGITGVVAAAAGFSVTFPIAFPNAALFATNIPVTLNTIAQTAPVVSALGTTYFSATNATGISNTFRWFTIGY